MIVAVTLSVMAELKLSFVELQHKVLMEYFNQREWQMNKYETKEYDLAHTYNCQSHRSLM
jgi:hypothetical protein